MRWKSALWSICLLALSIAGLDVTLRPNRKAFEAGAWDPFTDSKVIESQQYASTQLARALVGLDPISPGHCLFIPKRQVMRFEELSSEEIIEISYLIRRTHQVMESLFGPCDYMLLQKNGPNVGQSVAHVHWHYIPRKADQRSVLGFALNFILPFHSRLSPEQMQSEVDKLKRAFSQLEPIGDEGLELKPLD